MQPQCTYLGLTGIVTDRVPSEEFLGQYLPEEWNKAIKHYVSEKYGSVDSGVASTFWGIDDLLQYSMIFNLETGTHHKPEFRTKNDQFVPSMPLCGGGSIQENCGLDEEMQKCAAMRELLVQSLDYLNGDRKGRYFILTSYQEGCCPFKGGVIKATVDEIQELLSELRGQDAGKV